MGKYRRRKSRKKFTRKRNRPSSKVYRKKCFKVHKMVCVVCGSTKHPVTVHHFDCNPWNCNISNLIPMCIECHKRLHEHKFIGYERDYVFHKVKKYRNEFIKLHGY